jgi:hypothetical protein
MHHLIIDIQACTEMISVYAPNTDWSILSSVRYNQTIKLVMPPAKNTL